MMAGYTQLPQTRHKVFVSYHHGNDQYYRDTFERMFAQYYNIIISHSVQIGDIDPNLPTETIRARIRDNHLRDSTVTVVLVGSQTWQRKHVDWEIGSSIRNTQHNPRSGLLGILLPTYPGFARGEYNTYNIPPRLHQNIECGYAKVYTWSSSPDTVWQWIHDAYLRRRTSIPSNGYPSFVYNKSGERWYP